MKISFKVLSAVLFISFTNFVSGQENNVSYKLVSTIVVGDSLKWDYLFIDTVNNHLFVSHQKKTLVIDLETEKVIGEINPTPGVHGIAIANEFGKGFISNGENSTVTVFDLKTLQVISTIPAGGQKPDAIMYDAFSKTVFVCNGDDSSITLLDPESLTVKKVISLPGGPETAVTDQKGTIFINIEDKGLLVSVDAVKQSIIGKYSLEPGSTPTGLAIDRQNGLLFSGCRGNKAIEVVDAISGKVVKTLPIGGKVDAVAFDPASATFFSSNGEGSLSFYQEKGNNQFELVQTLNTKSGCKTMTFDTRTHKIYVPVMDRMVNGLGRNVRSFNIFVYSR